MHQRLADATFRIVAGNSSGSGFSYVSDRLVVTNHHVIEPHLSSGASIAAVTEAGVALPARLVVYSPKDEADFAVLELQQQLPAGRVVLQPAPSPSTARGARVLFSGFPHGIPDLLVHEAAISAPLASHAFYIDGSVNGGNSGGPIVDASTGELVGIVTQRRFMGGSSLEALAPQVAQLSNQCAAIANRGSVEIMGINFGNFAAMMAQGLSAISQVIQANANSGIGIGFHIRYVNAELQSRGLMASA
ncbi:serine protease [Lysobacter korlensis]|uniref:Serine protease n=1 Tax=Lysobacter korlensis TaxID=553636 RepID=A0ABV6S462_9GAMM